MPYLKGDGEALFDNFCAHWASPLPTRLQLTIHAIADAFIGQHARAYVGEMFKLTKNQALLTLKMESLDLSDAQAHSWLETMEERAGFTFTDPKVPESAALVNKSTVVISHKKAPNEFLRALTVSEDLVARGVGSETVVLSDRCFTFPHTINPTVNPIMEKEYEWMLDQILEEVGDSHGKINLGMPYCRKLAMAIWKKSIKIPNYGKTLGSERDLAKSLNQKSKNRRFVRASCV